MQGLQSVKGVKSRSLVRDDLPGYLQGCVCQEGATGVRRNGAACDEASIRGNKLGRGDVLSKRCGGYNVCARIMSTALHVETICVSCLGCLRSNCYRNVECGSNDCNYSHTCV